MTREDQSRKNNELFALFMQQVLDDPEFTDRIPEGAEIIFLPRSDPELYQENLRLGREREQEGHPLAYISIELVPEVRTMFVPRLELVRVAA